MKTFFRTFKLSLSSPTYYRDILQVRPRFSIKYYLVLSLLLLLISTISGIINYAPAIKSDSEVTAQEVVQNFPRDLVLTISPNGITSNKDFPIIAQMPSVVTRQDSQFKNLVVVDPNGEISALEKYNALMLINNSYLIVGNGDNLQTAPLKDFPETRVDYSTMQQLSQTLTFVAKNAAIFTSGFFIATGFFDFFIWRILYLAVFSLGLRLVYKSVIGTYPKAFQISMHSVTLPLLINTTLGVAGVVVPFPAWFLVVHTVFTFYVLSKLGFSR